LLPQFQEWELDRTQHPHMLTTYVVILGQIDIATYCFVALARCTLLPYLVSLYTAVHTIMTSKVTDSSVQKSFKMIQVINGN